MYVERFPGREHRGVWIATVANIDFPTSPNSSVEEQQAELRFLIEQLASARINAVYFQVSRSSCHINHHFLQRLFHEFQARPVCDALYSSNIEPWSKYLAGEQGLAPSPPWDPLSFLIDLCSQYDIEVHAWINPYRANMSPDKEGLHSSHIAHVHPEFAYPYGFYLWMDPGSEIIAKWTLNVALDLVRNYDLAGIHMDDYFYPYPVEGVPFPDDVTYGEYLNDGGLLSRNDWRRDNVNRLVARMGREIRALKPDVALTIAPFGIYRAGHPEGHPSPPIIGFDPYTQLFCDAKLWLQEGWIDSLIPQLYWRIDPPAQSYPILLDWWLDQNVAEKEVNAGIGLYRIESLDWELDEIRRQVEISRENGNRLRGSWGTVMFCAKYIRDNFKEVRDYLRDVVYPFPAHTLTQ